MISGWLVWFGCVGLVAFCLLRKKTHNHKKKLLKYAKEHDRDEFSRGSIVTSSLLVLKDVVKWVLIFRKKSGQQNPMAVTLAKNIVFHYVLGGFTRC